MISVCILEFAAHDVGEYAAVSIRASRFLLAGALLAPVATEALGLAGPDLPEPGGPTAMRIVPLPSGLATTQAEAQALRQHIADKLATEVGVTAWGGGGWLRLSAQVYNRPDEYDRLAERLPPLFSALQR